MAIDLGDAKNATTYATSFASIILRTEFPRNRFADPSAAPGHDGCLSIKLQFHFVLLYVSRFANLSTLILKYDDLLYFVSPPIRFGLRSTSFRLR